MVLAGIKVTDTPLVRDAIELSRSFTVDIDPHKKKEAR